MAVLVSGLFNLCEGEKTPKESLEGMKIRLMFGLLRLGNSELLQHRISQTLSLFSLYFMQSTEQPKANGLFNFFIAALFHLHTEKMSRALILSILVHIFAHLLFQSSSPLIHLLINPLL